jgi:putative transposase
MSRVFVRRPSGSFVEARYADLTLASVTLHEALAARRTLLAKGRREVDTRAIVGTAIEQRKLVDAAMKATATVRRGSTSSLKTKVDDSGWGSLRGIDSSKPVAFDEDME